MKIYNVGIYLRLSQEDKDKKNYDSESIKNQRNMLVQYISKHPDFYLTDEYCDEDLSGAGTYRPEFERLIKDCEKHKIDIVLCKSQSRFSRDMEIVEKYINNKFKEWNIRFIGLTDNADTDNSGNKKSRQINGLVNEWYLEDVSNNIRSAFYSKMKAGEYISPFAPYGYEISKENNNKLIIDQQAALIVKDIFKLYLNGLGYTGIAKYLNQKKIPCPSLYKFQKGCKLNIISNQPREKIRWNANAVKTILTNEVYLGHLVQGKRTTISYKNHKTIKKDKSKWIKFENAHDRIIDDETFNKVKQTMANRTKPMKKNGLIHIFSGKVFCFECNHCMRKKNSKKHVYLVCSNAENCINNSAIRYDDLEMLVLSAINKLINDYINENEVIDIIKEKNIENKRAFLNKKYNETRMLLLKNEQYLKNLYEDKVNGIITTEQFILLSKDYNNNNIAYNEQLNIINKEINKYKNNKLDDLIKKQIDKYRSLESLNRIVIDEFINKICIGKKENAKKRTIKIIWNI